MADSGSKTEKATPKKRRDQRKEGNVLQSKDVASLVTFAGSFFALSIFLEGMIVSIAQFMIRFLGIAGTMTDTSNGNVLTLSSLFAVTLAKSLLPFLLVCVLLGILGSGMQTRFLFATKNLKPKFSRLNPLEGFKKLFSMQNIVELVKSILKLIVLIVLTYSMLKADMASTVKTMQLDIAKSVAFTFSMLKTLIIRIVIAFVAIAALDYLYQWWSFERKLRMSKQEIKEEYKQTEGNPEIKGRIKNLQQQRARMRMMQAVPDADVIIRSNMTSIRTAHRSCLPRGRTNWHCVSSQSEKRARYRSSRTDRWRVPCMQKLKSTEKFRPHTMVLSRKFWFTYTS